MFFRIKTSSDKMCCIHSYYSHYYCTLRERGGRGGRGGEGREGEDFHV